MSSQVPNEPATGTSRSVLVSGASGFVGSALCDYMSQRGWEGRRLVRRTAKCSLEVEWDPEREIIQTVRGVGYRFVEDGASEL